MLDELKKSVGEETAQEILEGKKNVVASCGSGMTAGVVWLGLRLLGVQNVGVYDEASYVSIVAGMIANGLVELDWLCYES